MFDPEREHEIFNYYVNIVPSTYKTFFRTYQHYQFAANKNQITTQQFPAVYFRHDFSPLAVVFSKNQWPQIQHLLTSTCAILGGIFTLAGVLDRVLYTTVSSLVKNRDFSKL